MTDARDRSEEALEQFFMAARTHRPQPSQAVLERIVADGVRRQPVARAASASLGGRIRDWIAALGGMPAMTGMAAATLLGLWLGMDPQSPVLALESALLGPGYDLDLSDLAPDPENFPLEG